MEIQGTNIPGLNGQTLSANTTPVRPQAAAAPETGVTKPDQPTANAQPASKAQLQDAVKATNEFLKTVTNAVEFNLDEASGRTIVKVVDTSTKEVLRQFPSEEMLAIANALDKIQGLLIKQKV